MMHVFEWKSERADRVLGEMFLLRWNELEYRWAYRDEREHPEFVDLGGEG